jgi:hypothetical protein
MDATHGLAAILRDAAKWPLLRMRLEITFTGFKVGVHDIAGLFP